MSFGYRIHQSTMSVLKGHVLSRRAAPSVTVLFENLRYCDIMNTSETFSCPIGTVRNLRDGTPQQCHHGNLYLSLLPHSSHCLLCYLLVCAFSSESLRHRNHVFFFLDLPSTSPEPHWKKKLKMSN